MLKYNDRANLYKGEIKTESILWYFKRYDLIEHTNYEKLFVMIYVDCKIYTIAKISIVLNCDESTIRRHLKKLNQYIKLITSENID